MRQSTRLLIYSVVIALPILSGIIYGMWWEVWPFLALAVGLALIIEVIYKLQKKS